MTDQEELLGVFVEESVEHLKAIEPDLLKLEQDPENVDSAVGSSEHFDVQTAGRPSAP